ncbi:hypothetical protein APS_0046 [Acetobacter pasteurianus subsp. pasteurianus LMG 1262 = NBRC 106471]|nr:hypothetical protein APS_0046 [Acetobacter pasteurianus subsp. pasteurianus LMG 1262 = NBRC 106471]
MAAFQVACQCCNTFCYTRIKQKVLAKGFACIQPVPMDNIAQALQWGRQGLIPPSA